MDVYLNEAAALPAEINVEAIAEEALNAAFLLIQTRITEAVGGVTTGDVTPGEAASLKNVFEAFVRSQALNNEVCARVSDAAENHADDCGCGVACSY